MMLRSYSIIITLFTVNEPINGHRFWWYAQHIIMGREEKEKLGPTAKTVEGNDAVELLFLAYEYIWDHNEFVYEHGSTDSRI